MSVENTIHDYTHDPEFGLEWAKWLETLGGQEYRRQVQQGYTLDIESHKIQRTNGVIQCLSAMLARRDKEIEELRKGYVLIGSSFLQLIHKLGVEREMKDNPALIELKKIIEEVS